MGLILLVPPILAAANLNVPTDYATIQAGIDAAIVGDTVLVAPGEYYGKINYDGKLIVVKSSQGPLATTITGDSIMYSALVTFKNGETEEAILDGFTLRGGWLGIYCEGSGPTIRHNILIGQFTTEWAAISLAAPGYPPSAVKGPAPAKIINNTIINCANGGISSFSTVAPEIKNNIIAFNAKYGIHLQSSTLPVELSYNDVYYNKSKDYINATPGIASFSFNPLFETNYSLQNGSPCINRGDPDSKYNDPDGSRNDIGAVPCNGCEPPISHVFYVPLDYATIQDGIDATVSGDTVLVGPGTYTGDGNRDISFNGRNIVLMSSDGAATTILNCLADYSSQHRVIALISGEDSTAVVDGFTIQAAYSSDGAIVIANGTSATIKNCIINTCTAPIIDGSSGAITIRNNSSPLIDNCIIKRNNASGIAIWGSQPEIRGCLIYLNEMNGIYINYGDAIIVNCTIARNKLDGICHQGRYEKVMFGLSEDTVAASNSIIAYNVNASVINIGGLLPTVIIQCGDFYGNGSGNYSGSGGSTYFQLLDVISANPLFCSEANYNYSIAAASPCAPANNSCGVLMGAKPQGCSYLCGDVNHDNKVNLLDINRILSCLYRYWPCEYDRWAADVNADGRVNLSDISLLINFLYRNGPQLICQ
jgi:hypothetical protein